MFLCVSVSWLLKKVCEIENTSNQQAIGKLWDGIPRSQKLFLKQTFGCRNINTEAIPSYICSSVWARNEPWPFFAGREIGLQRAMIDTKMIIAGCKYLSCILRLCILAAVLMTGFMVILTASETQVIRRSVKGIISHETCFFFTGEEFGFNVDFGSISAKYGEDRFCGLTAKEVEQTFELAASNSESTSFWHHFTAEYLLQFFVAMGYAMFFVCVTVFRVTTTVFKEESTDDQCTSFMQQIWNLLFLTMLSAYLAFPMGSVRMLPEPVDNVAMVRTPPRLCSTSSLQSFLCGSVPLLPSNLDSMQGGGNGQPDQVHALHLVDCCNSNRVLCPPRLLPNVHSLPRPQLLSVSGLQLCSAWNLGQGFVVAYCSHRVRTFRVGTNR